MKKTLNIDDDLFEQAKKSCGATTDTSKTLPVGARKPPLSVKPPNGIG